MESDILDALDQLGYDGGLEEKKLLQAAEEGWSSPEFLHVCRWLLCRLKPRCDVTSGPEDSVRTELGVLLKELHCPHDVSRLLGGDKSEDHLKTLLFLASELQAARIIWGRSSSEQRPEERVEDHVEDLQDICRTLRLSTGQDDVFARIRVKVEDALQGLPGGSAGGPALKKPLSREQWETLHNINTMLSSEYECRRRMLIKRLDVTVQSFGWSDRAKVRLDSMAQVYQPRRLALRPQTSVDVARLLAAREDVCNLVKTSSGSSRERTSCAVNKVQMGRVPDRGGRPSEIQAPQPEMPPWTKRQEGGGRGGWRGGGWRGGGGGRGGRGGGGGGGRGGHGGKRGRYQY